MGWDSTFASRANSGRLNVGIIGLGYVGLPTAIGFRDAGFNVWGVDLSDRIVNSLHSGKNPLGDPDLDNMIPVLAQIDGILPNQQRTLPRIVMY